MHLREKLKAFGPVWDGAGTRGFSGEGYWYHRRLPRNLFHGSTFVAKTLPVDYNAGNMELTDTYEPRERFPKCVAVDWWNGRAVNAVGLPGPGLGKFLETDRWQNIRQPWMFSHMPIRKGDDAQEDETREFVGRIKKELHFFCAKHLAIQLNRSCPNVDANLAHLVETTEAHLSILAELELPIVVKLNLLVSPGAAARIAKHPACAGICTSNTIPFRQLWDEIAWELLYPDLESPLIERGLTQAGGLSGGNLVHLTASWIRQFRQIDSETYINGGLGVMRPEHVTLLHDAGANSIFFATVAMVRPWRVPSIIRRAHELV